MVVIINKFEKSTSLTLPLISHFHGFRIQNNIRNQLFINSFSSYFAHIIFDRIQIEWNQDLTGTSFKISYFHDKLPTESIIERQILIIERQILTTECQEYLILSKGKVRHIWWIKPNLKQQWYNWLIDKTCYPARPNTPNIT